MMPLFEKPPVMVNAPAPVELLPRTCSCEVLVVLNGLLMESVASATSVPLLVSAPLPPNAAPANCRTPVGPIELLLASVTVLFDTNSTCEPDPSPTISELKLTADESSVTWYDPASVMETSSPVVGTELLLQLDA